MTIIIKILWIVLFKLQKKGLIIVIIIYNLESKLKISKA